VRPICGSIDRTQFSFELFSFSSNALCGGWLTSRIPIGNAQHWHSTTQEKIMQTLLRAGAFALALLGSAGLAAAQGTPGSGNAPDQLQLSPSQKQSIRQGLMSEQTQTTAGSQGQVGSKTPASVTPHALPSDVTAQVPATKKFLFVKLPDRILLIDPDQQQVAEIILNDSDSNPGAQPR
jgi:hypothetical protein